MTRPVSGAEAVLERHAMDNKRWIRRVLEHTGDTPVPYNLALSPPARRRLEAHFGTDDVEAYLDLPTRMTGLGSIKPLPGFAGHPAGGVFVRRCSI